MSEKQNISELTLQLLKTKYCNLTLEEAWQKIIEDFITVFNLEYEEGVKKIEENRQQHKEEIIRMFEEMN